MRGFILLSRLSHQLRNNLITTNHHFTTPTVRIGPPRLCHGLVNGAAQRRFLHPSHTHVQEPTIYALSTAPGRAAIAVIRVSGPACKQVSPPPLHVQHERPRVRLLNNVRSIMASVRRNRFHSPGMRPSVNYTLPMCRLPPRPCLIRAH